MVIRKRFNEVDKSSIFHSSEYAKASRGDGLGSGAVSDQFNKRIIIEENRKIIQKYKNSIIGRTHNNLRLYNSKSSYSANGGESNTNLSERNNQSGGRVASNIDAESKPITSAPIRKYDPFA